MLYPMGRRGSWVFGSALTVLVVGGAACSEAGDDRDGFSSAEWRAIQQIQPLGLEMPANPFNNRWDDDIVGRLGQMLFFENTMSGPITVDNLSGKKGETGKVSCANCHDPKVFFVDTRTDPATGFRTAFSAGLGAPGKRNTPAMVNLGYFPWAGWVAQFDSLVMHGSGAIGAMTTRLAGAHYIYNHYREEYNAAFPLTPLDPALDPAAPDASRFPAAGNPKAVNTPDGPWETMTPADQKFMFVFAYNLGRTWDTYPRKLNSHGSAFERYVMGDSAALSPEAKRGLDLFINKAACNDCHTGPLLSDGRVHNIGVATLNSTPDMGRSASITSTLNHQFNGASEFSDDREAGKRKLATMPAADDTTMVGAFRTPMLLNIAETGPYFHTGQMRTLDDVVRFYNNGGGSPGTFPGTKDPKLRPLGLSPEELGDLVVFLKSLTAPPPEESWLKDTAKH